MTLTAPEWLTRRGGSLKLGSDGDTWYVVMNGEPHYSLVDVPLENRHGCVIRQTTNGRRIESPGAQDTTEAAMRNGLEILRQTLGWE